jgi:hypothetical protein
MTRRRALRPEIDMPSLHTLERIWARDDRGTRHAVTVTRTRPADSPHLQGPPRFSWGAGRSMALVDEQAGILECAGTGQRLKLEDWGR